MAHASKEGVTVADKEYLLGNKARELLKYAKKVSVIIGVDVKPRRKINSTRSVRALRRVKQEQNIRRKRGDITPRKDLFQPEPRPDSIPPWM